MVRRSILFRAYEWVTEDSYNGAERRFLGLGLGVPSIVLVLTCWWVGVSQAEHKVECAKRVCPAPLAPVLTRDWDCLCGPGEAP